MKNQPLVFRQGDVIIRAVSEIPKTAKRQKCKGKVILALGEVTGHHHRIELADYPKVHQFTDEETKATYIEVAEALAALVHEEHAPISIPKGRYRVTIQREYHPQEIRRVAD